MVSTLHRARPTIGVLAGYQYYGNVPLGRPYAPGVDPQPASASEQNLAMEAPDSLLHHWHLFPYLGPFYNGIRQAAADLNCNLLLACGIDHPSAGQVQPVHPAWPTLSRDTDFVPVGPWNTDGLIVVNPLLAAARSRYIQDLRDAGHPVVFIASGEAGPVIVMDNAAGLREAIQHLVLHGHRRIAFIAGNPEDRTNDTTERLQAYRAALLEHELPFDERNIAWGQYTYDGGYAAIRRLIDADPTFTALLASNDESAIGAMSALKAAGKRIPQDVAIIGFDDSLESAVHEPTLTTVAAPIFEMGYRAVEQVLRQIRKQALPAEPTKIAPHLVLRESCGCGQLSAPEVCDSGRESQKISMLRRHLTGALTASISCSDPAALADTIAMTLRQAAQGKDEATVWQAVFAAVNNELPVLLQAWPERAARDLLARAWAAIAASTWRRFRQHVVDQQQTNAYANSLTAYLQTALDETDIFDVLEQRLPAMGIQFAAVVISEPEGEDPVAWGRLRAITPPSKATMRFPSRQFPPEDLFSADQPFSLALLPLVGSRGQLGFAALDSLQLDSCLAIVQQMAAALNTAQLYREATEGQRLAEEASLMKTRFLSTVSHELRTPLNLIVGLGEILLRDSARGDTPLPPAAVNDIERLNANAQHLGRLINDVLDLASSDAGQLRLTRQLVDLGQALRPVSETGRQLAAAKGLAWHADLPESGPWVWGDRTRLAQVALNLVSNAIKYTTKGEVNLWLESGAPSGCVTVSVRDTGLGIPPEEQTAIFDEFRRSERSVARGYGGLGLGLAICKRLIELHGGTIDVRSTGQEGAGSVFYFTLPVVEPVAMPAPRATATATTGQAGVLVLTTSLDASERLRQHLAQDGVEVQMCLIDQALDCQAILLGAPLSAIVLDVGVASDQAWNVLRTLKANPATESIPVLFCGFSEDRGSILELDYLSKPIELAELTRALDQYSLAAAGERPDRSRWTFLVVDDDPDTLDMHARIVQAHSPNHRVLKAHNGRAALERLLGEHIDLVLLDLMMPEMDGFAVLEAMQEHESTRSIPVIVVTGQTLSGSEMARLNRGVTKVLSKGVFKLEEMLAHLKAALARQRGLSGEAQRLVRQAMAYLQERYAEPIVWQDVASSVGLSEDYLASCFRKELGLTPAAYLNRYRIDQAKRLLKNTHKSITEVALEVGFSGGSHFTRAFRRETGMTPGAYRHP